MLGPIVTMLLKRYGLTGLIPWATSAVIQKLAPEEFEIRLYDRPEFKSRFAGMFQLEAIGAPPISVDQYLEYEASAHAQAAMLGVKLSKAEVDTLIGNQVSNVELKGRFDLAGSAMFESDDETISELKRMNPTVNTGDLVRFFMNPKAELPRLQAQYSQAQIAGAALRTGFGQLTQMQAQRLQEVGVTREAAQQGFSQLQEMSEIFESFDVGETDISKAVGVEALAGNVEAQQELETRASRRKAAFQGGGGGFAGEEGFATGTAQ